MKTPRPTTVAPRQAATRRARTSRYQDGAFELVEDVVAREEPLEIRLRQGPGGPERDFTLTMRTPGNDPELALGLLYAEGVIGAPDDVTAVEFRPARGEAQEFNSLLVTLRAGLEVDWDSLRRPLAMNAACGVCGHASIDHLRRRARPPLSADRPEVGAAVLLSLPERLRAAQSVFAATGGLHAAGAFDLRGALASTREDVGRHNAVDKLVGAMLEGGRLPASDSILLVSGRAGFEIVQKAAVAGFPIVAAVGAPSSLAVDVARELGVTLVGFLREGRFNVYATPRRLVA